VKFLTSDRRWLIFVRVMNGIVMVLFGALASLDLVWNLGDLFMGCITLCNLFAIVKLHPRAVYLLQDYVRQKRAGIKSPTFHKRQMLDIAEELKAWDD
jgi:AGCS family alanine or glycine:cation symporter